MDSTQSYFEDVNVCDHHHHVCQSTIVYRLVRKRDQSDCCRKTLGILRPVSGIQNQNLNRHNRVVWFDDDAHFGRVNHLFHIDRKRGVFVLQMKKIVKRLLVMLQDCISEMNRSVSIHTQKNLLRCS